MIEVFADIWCPFAYVGLQIIRVRRHEQAPGAELRVRAWPLELVNGEPMDVGKTVAHVRDLRAQLQVGLFEGFDPQNFPTTTLPALAVVAAAERAGRGEEASFRVRGALWEDGLDVGDRSVAEQLADELGVTVTDTDRQSVRDDWHEGQRRGVVGSPHFFCGGRDVFCPSLSLARDDEGHLHIAPDPARLEAFLEECWG